MAGYPWYSHTMQKRRLGRSDLYLTPLGHSEVKNGYVYPKGEAERLTQILKLIHDRPNLRQALGDVGRVMVEERFSF